MTLIQIIGVVLITPKLDMELLEAHLGIRVSVLSPYWLMPLKPMINPKELQHMKRPVDFWFQTLSMCGYTKEKLREQYGRESKGINPL